MVLVVAWLAAALRLVVAPRVASAAAALRVVRQAARRQVGRQVVTRVARLVVTRVAPRVGRRVVTPVARVVALREGRAAGVVVARLEAELLVALAEVVLAVRQAARLAEPQEEFRVALRAAAQPVARAAAARAEEEAVRPVAQAEEAAVRPVAQVEVGSQVEQAAEARAAAPRVVVPGCQATPARSLVRRF